MSAAPRRWGWTEATQAKVELRLEELWFDRVEVKEDSGLRSFAVEDFLRQPLDQRLRWHFSGRLGFYRGQTQVDTLDAMKSLMAAAR
jgi:hypothetical protein